VSATLVIPGRATDSRDRWLPRMGPAGADLSHNRQAIALGSFGLGLWQEKREQTRHLYSESSVFLLALFSVEWPAESFCDVQ
jgi:hypothetical protein